MNQSTHPGFKTLTAAMARRATLDQFRSCRPSIPLDARGYTDRPENNLIDGVDLDDFRTDFEQGSGNELAGKFRAVHSSSALAANCFGPFKRRPEELYLAEANGFGSISFEHKCPVGLSQARTPPNLDLVAVGPGSVVGVESKFLEHLGRKTAKFADAYKDQINDARRDGPWYAEMMRLRDDPKYYRYLDAAQLIKHAFGLANTFPGKSTTLIYLFWEPNNAKDLNTIQEHREEVKDFAHRISGGFPSFEFLSYPELWDRWISLGSSFMVAHAGRLRERYCVSV
jgi:hypothetical protein